VDEASRAVGANSDLAVLLSIDLLVVLIEHVVKCLVDVVKVHENANLASLHASHNIMDEFVDRLLLLVMLEITSIEDFKLPV
jgi:hypothetical protein